MKYTQYLHDPFALLRSKVRNPKYLSWPGKLGHLDNQLTFAWSQGIYITVLIVFQ